MLCSVLQAPIKVFGIEGRYAHALFSAAAKQKAVDKVEKELSDFQVRAKVNKIVKNRFEIWTLNSV